MRMKIRIDTASEAVKLTNLAQCLNGEITITDSNGMRVSAKSLLGALYSLEFEEIWLESDNDYYSAFRDFAMEE